MRADGTKTVHWRRSAYCNANYGCVEVARLAGSTGPVIAIRDGTLPGAEALTLPLRLWRALLDDTKAGRLDGR